MIKTIEEKAKAYDRALEKIHQFIDGYSRREISKEELEDIFPELKESEDEKIRKALIKYYSFDKDGGSHALDNITPKQIVAWLEKQNIDISSFPEEQQVFMQKYTDLDKITLIKLLAERDANNAEIIESFEKQGEQKPVEPQQDMLSQEKYAKAVDECIYGEQNTNIQINPSEYINDMGGNGCYLKNTTQHPAWSEEDERLFQIVIDILDRENHLGNIIRTDLIACVKKLKSLRPKSNQEVDEQIETIAMHLDNCGDTAMAEILRSCNLRPQNTWKPSDYQIEALESATENCAYSEYQDCLRELIGQLKKLKG